MVRRAPGELPDVSTEVSQSPNDGVKDLGRTDENDPIFTISRRRRSIIHAEVRVRS